MTIKKHSTTEKGSAKLLFTNNATTSDLDPLLLVENVTSDESLKQYTKTNIVSNHESAIPHTSEDANIPAKQLARRRRRQRQRQRRQQKRQEERQQQEAQLQRQKQQQQRRRQSRKQQIQRPNELQTQQQQQQQQQQVRQRIRYPSKTWSEEYREREYWYSQGFRDYMEEYNTPLLEAYDSEKMDPKHRREQEELNDFEGFFIIEQLALINDQHEQLHQSEIIQDNEQQATQQQN